MSKDVVYKWFLTVFKHEFKKEIKCSSETNLSLKKWDIYVIRLKKQLMKLPKKLRTSFQSSK